MSKSKYDLFIFYDKQENRIIEMCWDTSVNGVSEWWHYDGTQTWRKIGNGYISKAAKKWSLLERVPEGIWKCC